MIAAAYQPFFAPFPGFFAKAILAGVLVLLPALDLLFCCGPKAPGVLQGWVREPTALLEP